MKTVADPGRVLNELREWPEGLLINWSELACRHNVPGRNAGQVERICKEAQC